MELWKAVVLGCIQGLTEFLPISSSGHLVIAQSFLKIPDQLVISFDIAVHIGTLVAVIAYFRRELADLIMGILARDRYALRLTGYLILGTIPAIILGFLFKDFLEKAFSQAVWTGVELIINGFILILADRFNGRRPIEGLKAGDALWVGIGQAVAIIPGISRSGSTMAAGLWRGFSRQAAARYSFLLSIPVILGAGLLEVKGIFEGGYQQIGPLSFWLGIFSSVVSGFLVIKYFLAFLQKGTFKFFGYYCLVIGAMVVVWFI